MCERHYTMDSPAHWWHMLNNWPKMPTVYTFTKLLDRRISTTGLLPPAILTHHGRRDRGVTP